MSSPLVQHPHPVQTSPKRSLWQGIQAWMSTQILPEPQIQVWTWGWVWEHPFLDPMLGPRELGSAVGKLYFGDGSM